MYYVSTNNKQKLYVVKMFKLGPTAEQVQFQVFL